MSRIKTLDVASRKYQWSLPKGAAVARYALEGLPNKILAAEYRTTLPDEESLAAELQRTRELLERKKRFRE